MSEEVQLCLDETREGMEKSIHHLEMELAKIRAGKANPSILDGINVEAYGASTPINQLGNIAAPDPKTISIQPWDKSVLQEMERAILKANIGLTPMNDGEFIRLNIPPLTEERRIDLVKQTKTTAENAKISIRNVRRDANDMIKSLQKDGMAEDMAKKAESLIQNMTNEFTDKVDKYFEAKESEIMTV